MGLHVGGLLGRPREDRAISVGAAGYSLVPYDVGQVLGPSTDANQEVLALWPQHPGIVVSSVQVGGFPIMDGIVPSWLTFIGPGLKSRVDAAVFTTLAATDGIDVFDVGEGTGIQAGERPRWNIETGDPLSVVARALAPISTERELGDSVGTTVQAVLSRLRRT